MSETFYGYIETTQDVLLVFEGCKRGLLPKVCRRLQEKERKMIRSGSVFVFDERESGIKRWTDGLVWSPSRILGNFLIYRELDKRVPGDKKLSLSGESRQRSFSADQSGMVVESSMSNDRNRERRLVGSLSDSYRFRKDGLIKKTMSITINGVAQHLISYYMPHDIIANKLRTPSSVPELASLEISPELLVKQNFRIPPMVEPPFDQADAGLTDDRRIHPFRSMSLGSLRNSNQYQQSMLGRNDPNSSQLMYTSPIGQPKLELGNSMSKNMSNVNLSTDYGNQNVPFYSNTSGFAPLPSPSSMTSSPNTPMLSPVRHSFSQSHQARHYSMPVTSTGNGSIQRFGYRNSFDMMSIQNDRPQVGSVHPHMIPEVNVYYNEPRIKSENDHDYEPSCQQPQQQQSQQQQSSFTSSPNIGQLLNPIHPLNKNPNQIQTGSDNNALFQSMGIPNNTTSSYPNYSSMNNNRSSFDGKLPSIPDNNILRNNTNNTTTGGGGGGGGGGSGYGGYDSFYNQRQQPLANTHSVSNNIVPMFRNGNVHPSSTMYDEIQTYSNDRPELGMEPLMLK